MNSKNTTGSFESDQKEPFSEKLNRLLKGRSLYRAAKDWNVNFSTLKNYYARPESTPRVEVARKIAAVEGVSLEWLLDRDSKETEPCMDKFFGDVIVSADQATIVDIDPLECEFTNESKADYEIGLSSIFSILSEEEKLSLFELIVRKGVDTVLQLKDERNLKFIQCNDYDKDRLLILLDSGAKKETSETSEGIANPGPSAHSKKAG